MSSVHPPANPNDLEVTLKLRMHEWRRILSALATVDGVFNEMARETSDQRSREFYAIDKAAMARDLRLKLQSKLERATAAKETTQ